MCVCVCVCVCIQRTKHSTANYKEHDRKQNHTLSAPVMACGSVTVARFAFTPGPGSYPSHSHPHLGGVRNPINVTYPSLWLTRILLLHTSSTTTLLSCYIPPLLLLCHLVTYLLYYYAAILLHTSSTTTLLSYYIPPLLYSTTLLTSLCSSGLTSFTY